MYIAMFCLGLFGMFCLVCQAYKSSYILVVSVIVQDSIQWGGLVSKCAYIYSDVVFFVVGFLKVFVYEAMFIC